jgi:hypothetical protein
LSVSLVAVTALFLSVFLARHRQPHAAAPDALDDGVERPELSLEELRRAGF